MNLPRTESITDLVWLQTGFIGDVVLTTAAIELVARLLPHVRQRAVTTPVGAQVLAGSAPLAQVITFDKAKSGTVESFKSTRAALRGALPAGAVPVVLQPHLSFRSSFLSRYLGYPTVTFKEAGAACLAARRVARVAPLHEAARVGLLLEPLGIPRQAIVAARPRLTALPLATEGPAAELIERFARHDGPVIAVAPGSVWGTKRWLPESFAALSAELLQAYPTSLIALIGSGAERPVADEVLAKLQAPPERLVDLRRFFPYLTLLVANDSSPIHYASAFAVPTVAVFGATVPGMGFGPLAPGSAAVGIELGCRPCSDHGPQVCPLGHFRCMRELSVAAVMKACRGALRT